MTPTSIKKEIIDKAIKNGFQEFKFKRIFISIEYKKYLYELKIRSEKYFQERQEFVRFSFDKNNQLLIDQLYLYITGNKKFKGKLEKGIHIWGDYGSGKSTILRAVCEIISDYSRRNIEYIPAKDFGDRLEKKGFDHYYKKSIFIDDIGRERREIVIFGNKKKPIPDLYDIRKENGAWTFQTCNKPIKDLNKEYGPYIIERMMAMLNEIKLEGGSRRP